MASYTIIGYNSSYQEEPYEGNFENFTDAVEEAQRFIKYSPYPQLYKPVVQIIKSEVMATVTAGGVEYER